jgi:hypothetical protein
MTRKLKLVPVLLLFLMASAFTNPGDSTTPTGGGVTERKFWGTQTTFSDCQNGVQFRTRHRYIFWIEVSESDPEPVACGPGN